MNQNKLRLLPAGLRFDGLMSFGDYKILQFTEHDASAPSHGASFCLALPVTLEAIVVRRAQKREQFAAARGSQ